MLEGQISKNGAICTIGGFATLSCPPTPTHSPPPSPADIFGQEKRGGTEGFTKGAGTLERDNRTLYVNYEGAGSYDLPKVSLVRTRIPASGSRIWGLIGWPHKNGKCWLNTRQLCDTPTPTLPSTSSLHTFSHTSYSTYSHTYPQ